MGNFGGGYMGYTAHSCKPWSRGAHLAPLSHTFAQHRVVRVHSSYKLSHNLKQLGYIAHRRQVFRPLQIISVCLQQKC